MQPKPSYRRRLIGVLFVLCWLCLATGTQAQRYRPLHAPALVWRGGTPASHLVRSRAAYMIGRGELAKSVAVARGLHADAYAKELQNSIDRVDTYFLRRELHENWMAKLNPNYIEREEARQENRRQRMTEQFHAVLEGNPTRSLNWLLVELSGPLQSLGHLTPNAAAALDDPSQELSPADVKLIQFSDGNLTYSASDPRILESRWPFALRAEIFGPLQKNFESARDAVLKEIVADGQASHEGGNRLIGAVDDLLVALETAYPHEEKLKPRVFSEYYSCKRRLRSLAWEVSQTVRNGDRSLFDGALRFEGSSVLELIWHMDRMGLVFAEPASGSGDRVYRSLLDSMQKLYVLQHE